MSAKKTPINLFMTKEVLSSLATREEIYYTAVENFLNNVCFPIFCAQELDTHLENLQIYTFPTKKKDVKN